MTSPKPTTPADPNDLRTALTKLAVPMYYDATPGAYPVTAVPMSHLLSALAAHPAPETDEVCGNCLGHGVETCAAHPAPVSDTRREDVAREAEIEREALRQFPDDPYMDDRDQVRLGFEAGAEWAFTRLAVLPAPPVVDEAALAEHLWPHMDGHDGPSAEEVASLVAAHLRGATRG